MARVNWQKYGLRPVRESGEARRFEDTQTGEILSRRQAENRRLAIDTGWDSWSQWQRTTSAYGGESKRSRQWQFFARKAVSEGKAPSRSSLRRPDSDFNVAYNEWRHTGFDRKNTAPDSELADFLVEAGLRDEGADYPVGDTPNSEG